MINKSATEEKLDLPCRFCCKHFKSLASYDTHINQVHRCPVCDKCFGKKEVIDHMKSHFGPDGMIMLENASVLETVVKQGKGDANSSIVEPTKTTSEMDTSFNSGKGEKRKRDAHESDDNVNDVSDESLKVDVDSRKLIVKIRKAVKNVVNDQKDDDSEEDEKDEDEDLEEIINGIKKEKDDHDDNNDGHGQGNANRERENDDNGRHDNNYTSHNNKYDQQNDGDCSEDGDNIDDSLYDDLDDDSYSPNKKNIKLARAQYFREISDRFSAIIKDNKCTMCGVACQFPNRIRRHVRKVHYCQFCDEFFSRDDLPQHLKEHDEPGKKHFCQFCGQICSSAHKLHYHDCSFKQKVALFYHCKICEEPLPSRDALTVHLRTHDPTDFASDCEQNTCQLCGFVFMGRPNLVRHMASRTCTHCGLQTVSSCQHQKHMMGNHHSRAYTCTSCETQFLSQHSYVDHVTERQCSGCDTKIEPSCEYLKHETLCKTGRERDTSSLELLCLKCDAILTDTYVYDCHVRDHNKFPAKYHCKLCQTQFTQNRDYGIHMNKRTCPQCLGKFHPMCAWSKHTCFRMDPPSISCPYCEKVFLKISSFRKHCRRIPCSHCPELEFDSVCAINKHYETDHPEEEKMKIIEDDDTPETPARDSLRMKIKIKEEVISEPEEDDEMSRDDTQSTPVVNSIKGWATKGCDHCTEYALPITVSRIKKHLQGTDCQICKERISPVCTIPQHYVQCAYNLAPTEENKDLLMAYLDTSAPVHCPLCRMKLNTLSGLKSHLRIAEHVCKECGEKFVAMCQLRLHQEKTKHGRRENICPICSKGFQYSRDLRKHILIHTGERPYDCLLCGNTYRNPGHLSYHLKVQHGGARPYKCKYCGRGFGALSGCNKHEKRHEKESKYKCEHCGMMFVAPQSLTKHLSHKVCLLETRDGLPQMLPNMLDDQGEGSEMIVKQEPIDNHVDNIDESSNMDDPVLKNNADMDDGNSDEADIDDGTVDEADFDNSFADDSHMDESNVGDLHADSTDKDDTIANQPALNTSKERAVLNSALMDDSYVADSSFNDSYLDDIDFDDPPIDNSPIDVDSDPDYRPRRRRTSSEKKKKSKKTKIKPRLHVPLLKQTTVENSVSGHEEETEDKSERTEETMKMKDSTRQENTEDTQMIKEEPLLE